MENLEQRIQRIEERNAKVELDKKWETSWTRRVLLTLFTYLSVSIYLWAIGISNPWLNAIVPAVAFMISTLTMPFFRKAWLKRTQKEKEDGNER
jgi:Kef-type K+ transport system membrane component KefB